LSDYDAGNQWPIKVNFGETRKKETRWTKYREAELYKRGCSPWEIVALKYNRFSNPRVGIFLKHLEEEIEAIQEHFNLGSLYEARVYRREHFEYLVDIGEIEEADPYIIMGYYE